MEKVPDLELEGPKKESCHFPCSLFSSNELLKYELLKYELETITSLNFGFLISFVSFTPLLRINLYYNYLYYNKIIKICIIM